MPACAGVQEICSDGLDFVRSQIAIRSLYSSTERKGWDIPWMNARQYIVMKIPQLLSSVCVGND